MSTCSISICNAIVPAPRRKYCSNACAREAIRQWKRAMRAATLADYRAGRTLVHPRLEGWAGDAERKAYFRTYMKEWRLRQREIAIALLVSTLALAGCEMPWTETQPAATAAEAPAHNAAEVHPVKIVVLEDQTGSRTTTRTEQVTPASLEPCIALLKETSGVLLVGAIRDTSNRTLIRLVIPPAPPRPVARPLPSNAFEALDVQALNDREQSAYEALDGEWQQDVDARVAEFLRNVEELTSNPKLAWRSAVAAAIARADAAVAEPETVSSEGRRFVVLSSDAVETTGKAITPLRSGAMLVVVNGAGILGSAAVVPGVQQFENLAAALLWVTETVRTLPASAQ